MVGGEPVPVDPSSPLPYSRLAIGTNGCALEFRPGGALSLGGLWRCLKRPRVGPALSRPPGEEPTASVGRYDSASRKRPLRRRPVAHRVRSS